MIQKGRNNGYQTLFIDFLMVRFLLFNILGVWRESHKLELK